MERKGILSCHSVQYSLHFFPESILRLENLDRCLLFCRLFSDEISVSTSIINQWASLSMSGKMSDMPQYDVMISGFGVLDLFTIEIADTSFDNRTVQFTQGICDSLKTLFIHEGRIGKFIGQFFLFS